MHRQREQALQRPELLAPDWPRWSAKLGNKAVEWLLRTPGVIGAWIDLRMLNDQSETNDLTMLVLMDPGFETSEGLEAKGRGLVVSGIAADVLRDTLEIDPEFAALVAKGYRLCGVDPVVFEITELAREIVSA